MFDLWRDADPRLLTLLALNLVVPHKQDRKYSSVHLVLPSILETQVKRKDYTPIIRALKLNQKPTPIQKESFDRANLTTVVSEVNASHVHISGNCALLAVSLMYNLLNVHECFLAVKNTYPIYEGVDPVVAEKVILGQSLSFSNQCSLDDLEKTIVDTYNKTGEKVFSIQAYEYSIPILGEMGHCFNALVYLDEHQQPQVQFMDAWRTSSPLPSMDMLRQHYNASTRFDILYCANKALLKNHSSPNVKDESIKTSLHLMKEMDKDNHSDDSFGDSHH